MNAVESDFLVLIQRLEAGDAGAFDVLYSRHGEEIRRAVRQQLHGRLRPQFDSLDFVQDVWASFVAMPSHKYAFEDPDSLGRFLARIARNKVIEVFRRRFRSQGSDIDREQPLVSVSDTAVADRSPSPSQVAMAGERWDEMWRTLPAGHRAILDRLREGRTHEEIAAMLGVHVRTVERVVRRLKELGGR